MFLFLHVSQYPGDLRSFDRVKIRCSSKMLTVRCVLKSNGLYDDFLLLNFKFCEGWLDGNGQLNLNRRKNGKEREENER